MGSEYSSWSVFCRRSSAMTRMVRMGTITTNTMLPKLSTYSKLLTAACRLYSMAPKPTIASRNAPNT